MVIETNVKSLVGIGIAIAVEAFGVCIVTKEAIRQHTRAIAAEKAVDILTTTVELQDITIDVLKREIDELEKEES